MKGRGLVSYGGSVYILKKSEITMPSSAGNESSMASLRYGPLCHWQISRIWAWKKAVNSALWIRYLHKKVSNKKNIKKLGGENDT